MRSGVEQGEGCFVWSVVSQLRGNRVVACIDGNSAVSRDSVIGRGFWSLIGGDLAVGRGLLFFGQRRFGRGLLVGGQRGLGSRRGLMY